MNNHIITDKMILKFALEYGYNMGFFKQYLIYQQKRKNLYNGKQTYEEFVLLECIENNIDMKEIYMGNHNLQENYAKWIGLGTVASIPDYLSFEHYCSYRDLCPHDPNKRDNNQIIRRNLKKR